MLIDDSTTPNQRFPSWLDFFLTTLSVILIFLLLPLICAGFLVYMIYCLLPVNK